MNERMIIKRSRVRLSKDDLAFTSIVYFLSAVIFLLVLYPLIFIVAASFSEPLEVIGGKVIFWPKGFNLAAYKAVFASNEIMTGYLNTIKITLLGTTINLIFTIAAAYPLSRPDLFGRNGITFFFTLTMFFSGGMIPTYITIQKLHLLDTIWSLVLPNAIVVTNMLIMRNFFQHSIPEELVEAAYMDGCSNLQTLSTIILPLSKAIIGVIVVYYFVGHWNSYFQALLYITSSAKYPIQVFLREILIESTSSQLSGASGGAAEMALLSETLKYAVIVVASIPALVIFPFIQKFFEKGVMIGAIKG